MTLVNHRQKSSLVSVVLVFLQDVFSLPPKCKVENVVGVVPIETCNRSSWEVPGIELFKSIE